MLKTQAFAGLVLLLESSTSRNESFPKPVDDFVAGILEESESCARGNSDEFCSVSQR
jgi:hypothetical protein